MSGSSQLALKTFKVTVSFFSGKDLYGVETYSVVAANWYLAERQALLASVESCYDNERIPNLRREAHAQDD